jgi:hypothetical protein
MENVAFTITGSGNISLSLDNRSYMVNPDHINYGKIVDCLKSGDYNDIYNYVNVVDTIASKSKGEITFEDGTVYWNNVVLHNSITERILQFYTDDLPYEPLLNMVKNLWLNPSENSREQIYRFLETNNLPVTPDGCILFYKRVRDNYKDHYTGKLDNSVGNRVTMPRSEVVEDANKTCESGLHVCSLGYLKHFQNGSKIVICKVNPAHIVSVPTDYENTKVRVSEYLVVAEWNSDEVDMFDGDLVRNEDGSEWDDDTDWDDDTEDTYGDFSESDLQERVDCGAMSKVESDLWKMMNPPAPSEACCGGEATCRKDCECNINRYINFGVKPDGKIYHNKRDASGKFMKG